MIVVGTIRARETWPDRWNGWWEVGVSPKLSLLFLFPPNGSLTSLLRAKPVPSDSEIQELPPIPSTSVESSFPF